MNEFISIPLSVYQQTREALDAAILSTQDESEVFGALVKAKTSLENSVSGGEKSGTMQRQQGFNLLKQLDNVRRKIREDYGIDEAA